MPNVVESFYHDLTSPTTNPPAWALSGEIWITLFMAILVPLAFLRHLDSLRHASYIALFSVGESCFCMFSRCNYATSSISCGRCGNMLLSTARGYHCARGSQTYTLHAELCVDLPCASICFYMCTEREFATLSLDELY
jgi:hypothetical protein